MARFDRIKEEIGWLKIVLSVCVAADISLVGWLAQYYARVESHVIIAALLAIVGFSFAILWVNREVYKLLEELEEL